ncbi:hypothetical protein GIB67_040756 [Kingdonia uniflora]|uniref:Uncharacterized protein n=1 Tax=Kingdonia uniflora TaxID=39325 RepID=A0A7J7KUJ7_9MAGN|nr:hypothetical protein GIB67_040756 [Kingdonia uniflora]
MRSKNLKPSSKFVVSSSSEESSSSDRTMDDLEVIGTVTVDKPTVLSGRDVGLQAGIETGQFFMTLVRPDGKIDHYQVPLLDKWKGNMGIGDDIDISYYNGTGAEVVEDGFLCYLNQVVYGLSIPLTFFQKGVINTLKSCPGQLNGNVFEMMKVGKTLNKRWRDYGIARQFVADNVLKYYKFKYVKDRKSGYLFSDSARPKFFNFKSARRLWCDHLMMVRGNCMQVSGESTLELIYKNFNEKPNPKGVADTSSLFDAVSRKGTELNKVLGALGIRRKKERLNSIVEKVQRAHQNRAMATSCSAYDDILEIPACVMGTSSSLVRRPRVKRTIPPSEQIALVQTPQVETEGLSVAWKSAAEVLKVDAADRAEYEAEKASLAEQLKEGNVLCKKLQKEKVQQREQFEKEKALEDVDHALAGKYSEIIFPEDDASLVAEQSPAPPVADDTTKEEVDRLRGKVSEMENALSIARDSINRNQQNDRFALLQKSLKDKRFVDESDNLECQRSLLSLTLYFEAEVDSERGLKEAYLELLTERGIVPNPARVKFLAQEARNCHGIEACNDAQLGLEYPSYGVVQVHCLMSLTFVGAKSNEDPFLQYKKGR